MQIRPITDTYAVSPQIDPADIPEIKAAGFTTVICNRPDAEVPMELQSAVVRIAAEAAGLTFVDIPVSHQTLNLGMVEAQFAAIEASAGPVLAYCASGNRSSIVWCLGQAGKMPVDEIITTVAQAGYNQSALRPQLEALSRR
ncbi:MAG TPA: TIGR01244 family sulfur transferase [Paracoccaceae bacterium]|nr:TIGR01244 family sulfur transferase [Paracoccaceae bacterium]